MEGGQTKSSPVSWKMARSKWGKRLAVVNSTVAATSELTRERLEKQFLAGVNRTNITLAASQKMFRKTGKWLAARVNGSKTEATSGSSRISSPASSANVSIRPDEIALLPVNQAPISTEESILEIQRVVTPPGTSPDTQYYSCTEAEQDDDNKGNCKVPRRRNSWKGSISLETDDFSSLDVQPSNAGNENREVCRRRDGSKQKVLEWIFAIANFIVELLSIAFDQLSSQKKPVFMPVCMGMSILAVLICLLELVYKIRKEKAIWKRKGVFPWFYHPSGVRFGSFADVIGLVCASGQCILTAINYSLFLKHVNVPINVSIWPIIFASGQLLSKMWGEFKQNVHKRESSSTEAGLIEPSEALSDVF